MILPIYLYGSEVLRRKAEPADLNDREGLAALVQNLKDTLAVADGCGLAAPQIGVSQRVVIVDGDVISDVYDYCKGFKRVLINPVITFKEGEVVDTEGCLSVPDIYGEVTRAAKVKVEFMNRRGKRQHLTATGLLARCIQHELDHLEGQLFIDIAKSVHRGNQS